MTTLDWLLLAFLALFALIGFHRGLIVGILSIGGFLAGAFAGTRLAPLLLPHGSASPYAPALGLLGALFAGALLAAGLEGFGLRLRRALRLPLLDIFDGVLGAIFATAVGLGIIWVVAALLMQAPLSSGLRSAFSRSAIVRALDSALPPSGPILDALSRLDPLPRIAGPPTQVLAPPDSALAREAAVQGAARSVVRVLGTACGMAIEGSGWVAAGDLVVTNAHVVAGESHTVVERSGEGPELPARIVAFDAREDLALLEVPGLALPPLALAAASAPEAAGVVVGYPEDGPLTLDPARIGEAQSVVTQNAYGEGPVRRLLTPIRGLIRPGNSGGPVIGAGGRVLATVFASTTSGGAPGGYGVANASVAALLSRPREAVGQSRCDSL
ncbi:MAG TPA: MarP family serine protease [Solirubrobacteraceae bacterium]|nr:MarP family serine protease [Solirubrobacteraceae bacterium]